MIKLENGAAAREPLPTFLEGLAPESLEDLSWTDPALGVSDAAWWPEDDQSPALGEFQRYGSETLTIDSERRVVVVVRQVVPWSAEEIAAYRKSLVPESVTMRQARLALHGAGILSQVQPAIDVLPDTPRTLAQIEWDYSSEMYRNREFVNMLGSNLGLTDEQIDELFIQAATL